MQNPVGRNDVEELPDAKDVGQYDIRDTVSGGVGHQQGYRSDHCRPSSSVPLFLETGGRRKGDARGIGNLNLHRISKTSSINPKNVAMSKLSKLARYVANEWCGKERVPSRRYGWHAIGTPAEEEGVIKLAAAVVVVFRREEKEEEDERKEEGRREER